MSISHPFVERIRLERHVIGLVNQYCSYFSIELSGLSQKAIQHWFLSISQPMRKDRSIETVREKLEYLGRFARISSNGSHRGAMVAPPPQKEVVFAEVSRLEELLGQLAS